MPENRNHHAGDRTHIQLAEVFILAMRARAEDLVITADQMWPYAGGLWVTAPRDRCRWLARQIEIAVEGLGLRSENRLINETRGYLLRSELFQPEIEWDAHGLVPTQSGLLDPAGEVPMSLTPAEAEHRSG